MKTIYKTNTNKILNTVAVPVIALLGTACTNLSATNLVSDTNSNVSQNMTTPYPATNKSQQVTAGLTSYQLDPHHSNVRFSINHMGTSTVTGGFYELTGEVAYSASAQMGKADITIPMASLHSVSSQFTEHLKGKDFFDVANYPTARFVSSKWYFDGTGNDAKVTRVDGDLTMHGKTSPVSLKATNFNCYFSPVVKKTMCGGDFTTTIDRTKWGINKYVLMGVPKELRIDIEIEGIKQ